MQHRPTRRGITVTALALVAVLLAGCGTDGSGRVPDGDHDDHTPLDTGVPGLLWLGDLETGDLSQYADTPWNLAGGAEAPEVVTDPVREGEYALAVTIPGVSDGEGITADSRNEVEPRYPYISEGEELWFGFSTMLGEGFPVDEEWQVITQWKNDGAGSPPIELSAQNGTWAVAGGAGSPEEVDPYFIPVADLVTGEWVDWVFRIRFSADPEVGEVEVWKDGEVVLPTYHPESGTMYEPKDDSEFDVPKSYLKTGYYRAADISQPATVYYDSWRIGTEAAVVAPPSRS